MRRAVVPDRIRIVDLDNKDIGCRTRNRINVSREETSVCESTWACEIASHYVVMTGIEMEDYSVTLRGSGDIWCERKATDADFNVVSRSHSCMSECEGEKNVLLGKHCGGFCFGTRVNVG
jgi:hypothetical protein